MATISYTHPRRTRAIDLRHPNPERARTTARLSGQCSAIYSNLHPFRCTLTRGHTGTEHQDHATDAPSVVAWQDPVPRRRPIVLRAGQSVNLSRLAAQGA